MYKGEAGDFSLPFFLSLLSMEKEIHSLLGISDLYQNGMLREYSGFNSNVSSVDNTCGIMLIATKTYFDLSQKKEKEKSGLH